MAETENQTDTQPAVADAAPSTAEVAVEAAPAPTATPAVEAPTAEPVADPSANGAAVSASDDAGEAKDEESMGAESSAPALPENEMSFAEMFELAEKQSRDKKKTAGKGKDKDGLRPGRIVEAKVVAFSHDSVFVDLGGKAEGVMLRADLLNDEGELTVKEGDTVEGRVISFDGGTIRLGKALGADSVRNRESVREAFEAGMPVEGRVTGQNKGGLEVEVGGLRAFCPISQIDTRFRKDVSEFIGQKLNFRITEFKNNGRNVVVSRRDLLEEENAKKAEELLSKISVGQVIIGQVTSVKDYGAFVDIGGLEGLVHVSEITHGRISKAGDRLSIGQQMDVQVMKIQDDPKGNGKKISLSMKSLENDPWEDARERLRESMKITGKVQRIQPFGAFVEVLPGVDGLIHVSNMSNDRINNPRDLVTEGQEVEATIVSLDWQKRRIGLSLVKSRQELARELSTGGKVYDGTVDRIESFGLFVKLPTGARGLVPASETGTERGTDLTKQFEQGETVKVTVLETEKKTGKIRLSIKAAAQAEERALYSSYMNQSGPGKGLGTFADLFKGKISK